MNYLIISTLLSTAFHYHGCRGENNLYVQMAVHFEDCLKNYPAMVHDEAIKILGHEKIPVTKDELCLVLCTLERTGVIKDGKAVVEAFKTIQELEWSDPVHLKTTMKNTLLCKQENDGIKDDCERVGKIIACYFTKNNKDNVPLPKSWKTYLR